MGNSESGANSKIYNYKCLHLKTRNISNQQPNFKTSGTRNRRIK